MLKAYAIKEFNTVLRPYTEAVSIKDETNWNYVFMEYLLTSSNASGLYADGDTIVVKEKFKYIERNLWFHLGKYVWKNHHSVFNNHVRYTANDIHKPFRGKSLTVMNNHVSCLR